MKLHLKLFRTLPIAFFFVALSSVPAHSAKTDTVETFSASMRKNIKAVIIMPDDYKASNPLPVVYLLHGYSGNYSDWVVRAKGVDQLADLHEMIIVCPDGGYGSWYWDSPVDSSSRYETYIAKELVAWVDARYATVRSPKGRAITGLSMGGHGALFLAFRHQDVFGAAGSMSGGVDIRPFSNNWEITKRLGPYQEFPERWESHTVINLLHLLKKDALAIIIDCGRDDFFYEVNEALHRALLYRNIPHEYISRPGGHNWPYWTNAVPFQMLFFKNFFSLP
ncbi:MAG: alpha/beta hydrolase [Saprospiraceae bacterium]